MDVDAKLAELFIDLPEASTIYGGAVHALRTGKHLWIGGQLPMQDGKLVARGRVGVAVRLDAAKLAARAATVQALAAIARECGGTLNHVKRIVRLDVQVATGAEFFDHEKVAAAAGELLTSLFGIAGEHVRTVSGVESLPQGACVQVGMMVELK